MPPRYSLARPLAAAGMVMVCAQTATATIFDWNWSPAAGGANAINNAGGAIDSLSAGYDDATKRLTFSVNFADRLTEGFYLVLTGGESPVGQSGRYSIFYFDAYDVFDADATTDIKLTSYGYNGSNGHSSWRDGNRAVPGDQAPDLIKSSLDSSWVVGASASNIVLAGGIHGRSMSFEVDAHDLLTHSPQYPNALPWKGTGFADLLGIKFVPAEVYEADYYSAGDIEWLGTENEGGFEGEFQTLRIPAPGGAIALAAAGLLMGLRRARRTPSAPQTPDHSPGAPHSRH